MTDSKSYLQSLLITNILRESTLRQIIQTLAFPPGSRGLDAGCGIGLQSVLLAEAIGPDGHVTGLDVAPEFLNYGRELVEEKGLAERVSFREGSVASLPFKNSTFDWAWSSDCVGYGPSPPLPLLTELIRVVRPGGVVAILAWSSERLLPGYPRLEARLEATTPGLAPFVHGKNPDLHFLRALGWFRELGLEDSKAESFAGSVCAPLSLDMFDALKAMIDMRWPEAESELASDDAAEYKRVCYHDSPEFILNCPDYHAFFTYSVFSGRVPR